MNLTENGFFNPTRQKAATALRPFERANVQEAGLKRTLRLSFLPNHKELSFLLMVNLVKSVKFEWNNHTQNDQTN